MTWLYLLIDLSAVSIPLIFSFHPRIGFYKEWRYFLPANLIVALVFLLWDAWFTSLNVWSFNPHYVTGTYVYNQPVEEILFFICIPYACVFTYFCLDKFYKLRWKPRAEFILCITLALGLLITGILYSDRLYTSVTFISTALVILALKFVFRVKWFSNGFSVYLVLLIPFLIVNGILTGTGIDEPVVIYNNVENLGLRILTIPVEDIFYGFEMLLLNLFLYKTFKGSHQT